MTHLQLRDRGRDDVMARVRAARPDSAPAARLLESRGPSILEGVLAVERGAAAGRQVRHPTGRRAVVTHRWVRTGASAAVAAAAAVALVLGPSAGRGPAPGPGTTVVVGDQRAAATAPAGTALIALASTARFETSDGGGAVAYTAETVANREQDDRGPMVTEVHQRWLAPDGSGRDSVSSFPSTPEEDSWAPGGSPDGGGWRAGDLRGLRVADLSTDPAALAALVAAWAREQPRMVGNTDDPAPVSATELVFLESLLGEPTATPDQRAAAFEALAARDDVGLLGDHTDPLGRPGTAVEYDLHNGATWRVTLTFDPTTSALLSSESTLVDLGGQAWLAGAPLGTWSWSATTTSTMVDAVGEQPVARRDGLRGTGALSRTATAPARRVPPSVAASGHGRSQRVHPRDHRRQRQLGRRPRRR